MNRKIKNIKINPRFENAEYEARIVFAGQVQDHISGLPMDTFRYESAEDASADINRIPPYLIEYDDGTTKEDLSPLVISPIIETLNT